jgi:hypothetical protein
MPDGHYTTEQWDAAWHAPNAEQMFYSIEGKIDARTVPHDALAALLGKTPNYLRRFTHVSPDIVKVALESDLGSKFGSVLGSLSMDQIRVDTSKVDERTLEAIIKQAPYGIFAVEDPSNHLIKVAMQASHEVASDIGERWIGDMPDDIRALVPKGGMYGSANPITEGHMDYRGTRIYDLNTRRQFLGLLKRYNYLRGFIDGVGGYVYAWDAMAAVHPDVGGMFDHGEHGVPVQFTSSGISIRPHGLHDDDVRLMYREIMNTPLVKVLYGGKMPEIWIEDDEVPDRRIDNLGWEDESDHERNSTSTSYRDDERWTAWRRNWGSY